MKQRVSDFIADYLFSCGVKDCFTVTGGGAMFLNDSFGHHKGIKCTYFHHEQSAAMAAEAYSRIDGKIAVVCVTTGPGSTNAITGVAGAWMDSIPMLVISGQARYATTVYNSGLNLRTKGIQEFDIIGSVKNMTKYCELVKNPKDIKKHLKKALYLAKSGHPGPCWLDIPLDVQGAIIDTDELYEDSAPLLSFNATDNMVDGIIEKLKSAKRPLLFAGNGIRLAGAHELFLEFVSKSGIPVVTGMSSVDGISNDNDYYVGRNGTTGDRAGNFAVQNCDMLLSLGSRQSYNQTGFETSRWAENAYIAVNNIDSEELKRSDIRIDLKLNCDVKDLLIKLLRRIKSPLGDYSEWLKKCHYWKTHYPVVLNKHYNDENANIYAFYNDMTSILPDDMCLVVSAGTSRVVGSQVAVIKEGQRFITNPSMASLGYDLPPSIGVCLARNRKKTILATGDGGFQMNIQELQTIKHHQLPIVIFVLNNSGYHSVRMTQRSFFGEPLVGVGEESGDLSFPCLAKLIPAWGIKYFSIENNSQITDVVNEVLAFDGPCVCEVFLSKNQITEPKVASIKLPNGQMKSGTLVDMFPFLSEEEMKKNMIDYSKEN